MFDKLKQLKELNRLRESLGQERIEAGKNGITVIVNGKMEIEKISLNPELKKEDQEAILKDCVNEALKKIQILVAQKMSQVAGF